MIARVPEFLLGVASGVAATFVVGACRRLYHRIKRRHPLACQLTPLIPDAWQVVLPTGRSLPPRPANYNALGPRSVYDSLHQAGAVDAGRAEYRVVLTNTTDVWLHIVDITLLNLARGDAIEGTHILTEGGGANDGVRLLFNLDDDDPVAWHADWLGNRIGDSPYFPSHNISLEAGEPIPVEIILETQSHFCELQFQATVEIDGRRSAIPLLTGESRIRLTGTPAAGFVDHLMWHWATDTPGFISTPEVFRPHPPIA
jgi:hypothetical protein